MNQEINGIINKIRKSRVLVIGDAILDCSVDGDISGLSAEAPIMTFRERQISYTLGGAANVALNLKCANQDVVLASVIGDDDNGKILAELLEKQGVSTGGIVVDSKRKTTIKKRFYTSQKEQIFRSDSEDRFEINGEIENAIVQRVSDCIDSIDIIVLSDYLKGCLPRSLVKRVVALARKRGVLVAVDPKDADFTKYYDCDVLKPNKKELAMMVNKSACTLEDVIEGCKRICRENRHKMVVVTLGAKGMYACTEKGEEYRIDGIKVPTVDVSGAGDTAISYLAVGLASGMRFEEALILANAAAGKKVTKNGAVPVYRTELLCLSKRIEKGQLPLLRELLKDKRVVFTNGCFDLLHAGHIYSLTQAKAMGDVLVVGLNSDSSVRRLKGDSRPLIPMEERICTLEALSCVDYVIPFDEDTPIEIIEALMPQVLVKGTDYKDKPIVGADLVKANGGEIKLIEMYKGFSTTELVNKIKEI